MSNPIKPTESAVCFMAKMQDCRLQKSIKANYSGTKNTDGYMLVDANDEIVMGSEYTCTLEEIYKYLFAEINKEGNVLYGEIVLDNTNA